MQYVIGLVVVAVVALVVDVVRSRSDSGVLFDHRDRHLTWTAASG